MKKHLLLVVFFCGLLTIPLMATTYRVNNRLLDNAATKVYSTIQGAYDAASDGDTIMLEGSPDIYTSTFQFKKKLIIKGPGFFLSENPGISANKLPAVISSISFYEGSKGSALIGVTLSSPIYFFTGSGDITFRRCHISNTSWGSNTENITFSECYFLSSYTNIGSGSQMLTNLIIWNCIFNGTISITGTGSTGEFINNVFNSNNITIPNGFVMKNNILFTTEKTNVKLPDLNSFISYNISISDHFGTANNNKANVASGSLFIGTGSTDGKWQLKAGSPAIDAGEGGIDCGAFGGLGPYILSGVPTGPVIYQLNVSSHSVAGNKLPVTIKVKSY